MTIFRISKRNLFPFVVVTPSLSYFNSMMVCTCRFRLVSCTELWYSHGYILSPHSNKWPLPKRCLPLWAIISNKCPSWITPHPSTRLHWTHSPPLKTCKENMFLFPLNWWENQQWQLCDNKHANQYMCMCKVCNGLMVNLITCNHHFNKWKAKILN